MRAQHLESLASAWAEHGNNTREKILRGKLERNSTTMVTVQTEAGDTIDLTKKCDIKKAILK
jgi:hypothetical protein